MCKMQSQRNKKNQLLCYSILVRLLTKLFLLCEANVQLYTRNLSNTSSNRFIFAANMYETKRLCWHLLVFVMAKQVAVYWQHGQIYRGRFQYTPLMACLKRVVCWDSIDSFKQLCITLTWHFFSADCLVSVGYILWFSLFIGSMKFNNLCFVLLIIISNP